MCEIEDDLELIHKWAHKACEMLGEEDLKQADALGKRILDIVNDSERPNGVKLLALLGAMKSGITHMELREAEELAMKTIH